MQTFQSRMKASLCNSPKYWHHQIDDEGPIFLWPFRLAQTHTQRSQLPENWMKNKTMKIRISTERKSLCAEMKNTVLLVWTNRKGLICLLINRPISKLQLWLNLQKANLVVFRFTPCLIIEYQPGAALSFCDTIQNNAWATTF